MNIRHWDSYFKMFNNIDAHLKILTTAISYEETNVLSISATEEYWRKLW